jgi:hypothetical protein
MSYWFAGVPSETTTHQHQDLSAVGLVLIHHADPRRTHCARHFPPTEQSMDDIHYMLGDGGGQGDDHEEENNTSNNNNKKPVMQTLQSLSCQGCKMKTV